MYGSIPPADVSFIGRTNYAAALEEKKFIFGVKRIDRRRHLYIIGKSGMGKSKLLELMMRQDIAYQHGFCLMDPHGDVIDAMLDFIPEERIGDVCMVNLADAEFSVSFNPLSNVDPSFKHQLTQGFIEVMEKQFGENWTPRLEHLFRFACLALLDYPHATMWGMIMLLNNPEYRQQVVSYIQDDMVKHFWETEFLDWPLKFSTDGIIPLVDKLGRLFSNPLLRNIFSQEENKVNLEQLMNNGKIILINLSKGMLGEENASFFGSMFIAKIKQAGMARAALPERDRKDFHLYIDEFHDLVTKTFENLFFEARKYGFCLTMAHQYMSQLSTTVRSAVLGNVGSLFIFRVGGQDAVELEAEMTPVFKAKDMINLGIQQFYVKMIIDGDTYDPFSAETLKVLPPPHRSFREEIIRASRERYSIPADAAKRLIAEEGTVPASG